MKLLQNAKLMGANDQFCGDAKLSAISCICNVHRSVKHSSIHSKTTANVVTQRLFCIFVAPEEAIARNTSLRHLPNHICICSKLKMFSTTATQVTDRAVKH